MNINLFFRNVILGKIGDFFFQKCALLTKLAYIHQVMHITRLTRFLKKGLYTSCDVYRAICQTRHVNIVFLENGVYTSHDVHYQNMPDAEIRKSVLFMHLEICV